MSEKTLKLTLEYDGTGFRGWARQPGERTVEGTLREALDAVYGRWSDLAVAGRTDTGVHASGQVASLLAEGGPPPERAPEALNAALPADIAVLGVEPADEGLQRTLLGPVARVSLPDPAPRGSAHPSPTGARSGGRGRWISTRSQAAAALIPGKHDFTAFTPTETQHRLFTRTVLSAAWEDHGEELHFTIAAESFLRHMVRTLVGTMLEGRELALLEGGPAEAG